MASVLLLLDTINDLLHPDGAFGKSAVAEQVKARGVVLRTASLVARAREAGVHVGYVRIGFSEDYKEAPPWSPIFSPAREERFFRAASWGGQVHDALRPQAGDFEIVKHRVSPFYATTLDLVLRQLGTSDLYIAGVSTNGVIASAVKEAHDRDYRCHVFEDACAAANMANHDAAILISSRYAEILNSETFTFV